jgi:hypothetical protein
MEHGQPVEKSISWKAEEIVLIVATCLKVWGKNAFVPGLLIAMVVHCLYNLYFILGWLG